MRALIVGGGIAGLATARALQLRGVSVTVFERSAELRPAGAGISLWSNGIAALGHLGLADPVIARGGELEWVESGTAEGAVLMRIPSGAIGRRLGAPTIGIHRADLQAVLLDALDPQTVRLSAECVGVEQDRSGVTLHLADGSSERGDLLIGADGIGSVVRQQILADGPPRYVGYTAWRGVADGAEVGFPQTTTREYFGTGARFGVAPIGGDRLYWWATANVPPNGDDGPEGRKAELQRRFSGWASPITAIIDATPDSLILRNDILDREPVERWGIGCVTLVGDAAHPMTPNLGQGACQALEDAVTLADIVTRETDIVAALRRYEAARGPRTAAVTKLAWRIGQVGQWEHPLARSLRTLLLRLTPDFVVARQTEALLRFHVPDKRHG